MPVPLAVQGELQLSFSCLDTLGCAKKWAKIMRKKTHPLYLTGAKMMMGEKEELFMGNQMSQMVFDMSHLQYRVMMIVLHSPKQTYFLLCV